MSEETDKLANMTADALVTTHERLMDTRDRVRDQARRVDKLTDAAGERVRQASLATRFENWATARLSPRNRRSEKIATFDARVAELEQRMGAIGREQAELRERIPEAEREYGEALARFHADGKGARPVSAVPELEERLRQLADDYGALEALVGETLAEKTSYVEANRKALAKDAAQAVQEASAGYREAIDRLLAAREELVASRLDELYFKLYPSEAVASAPPQTPLVGGIIGRMREAVPGWQITLGVPELRRLLEADVEFVASMLTPAQQAALRERDPEAVRFDQEAIWTTTEAGQEALRRERQEARERYAREWGRQPGW
jgi:hypothetical protein